MPLIVSPDHPAVRRLLAANIAGDIPMRAKIVRADAGFHEQVVRAAALNGREYPKAIYVEDQLYEGGFFPLRVDEEAIEAFHRADPEARLALVDAMQDDRARQLGRRIIYNEFPEVLPTKERAVMESARVSRFQDSSGSWTSIAKALVEIDKLMPTATLSIAKVLEEYSRYLRGHVALGRA
jgi:exodeoxyribonuclease-1